MINVFSSIIDEVEKIVDGKSSYKQRREANNLLGIIQSFKSVFSLYLMRNILQATNELSKALQRKDQDIINVMSLVKISKTQLQKMSDENFVIIYIYYIASE